jgi:hypothetical protein
MGRYRTLRVAREMVSERTQTGLSRSRNNNVIFTVQTRLGCGQNEMERDKNQNFPTVILSFLMGERDRTVNVP